MEPLMDQNAPDAEVDTTNKFMVASQGGRVMILMPPRAPINNEDALLLAAYLVAITGLGHDKFTRVYDAVCNT